ncbi:MAG: iron uptake porin [Cyanobium sp.]
MKLVQPKLLWLPFLCLLAAPVGQAADLNLADVNHYASTDQVTSIDQFSEVKPDDWAYQALTNLIQTYGCVAGYPDGTYRGRGAMTRYEAAALLNACLDRVTERTDELKKLLKEFERELAILHGRVDGLEARLGEEEALQFSTTTRLRGVATFVVGANGFGGDAYPDLFDALTLLGIGGIPFTASNLQYANTARSLDGATAFAYDLSLYLDTSFTGKDLLRARLRTGNFADSPWFGTNNPIGLNAMEVAYEELCGAADCGDVMSVNRLFYQFPIGKGFTATVGGRVRQDDMLAMWPSAYPADTILDVFTYAGAPGAYNRSLGAGAGLWWTSGGFSLSTSYVALNGDQGSPGVATSFGESCDSNSGGLGGSCTQSTFTGQVAYRGETFGLAVAYSYAQGGAGLYGGNGTPLAVAASSFANNSSSVGISGYWMPFSGGLLPSISAGWGISGYRLEDGGVLTSWIDGAQSQSWYVGLQWSDLLGKGHAFGMAVGQPTFISRVDTAIPDDPNLNIPNDGNYAWEWWVKLQIRDAISVTPAIFYLSAPLGQLQKDEGGSLSNFGAVVKTTFRF